MRDWIADGWEIEYDRGDEVVLVDRDIGSIPLHVLLFFTTGGIGNLAYGWHKYSNDADRVVLRAGDDAPRPRRERATADRDRGAPPSDDDRSSSLGRYLGGISLLGVGALVLATGLLEPAQIVVGLTLLFAGLFVFPPTRNRIENRHPVTAFGPTRSVDERIVTDTDRPCSICLSEIDRGVAREYSEEYAVAGIPLYTTEEGENYYCSACATGESVATAGSGAGTETASADAADERERERESERA